MKSSAVDIAMFFGSTPAATATQEHRELPASSSRSASGLDQPLAVGVRTLEEEGKVARAP